MKSIILLSLMILLLLGASCYKENPTQELAELKREIQILKDSIHNFDMYYHFRKVKPIIHSKNETFLKGQEYKFICSMVAFQFYRDGKLIDMAVEGKSALGNSIQFDTSNIGEIVMTYIPKFSGVDTLALDFNFLKEGYRNGLSLPIFEEIIVLESENLEGSKI